MNYKKYLTIGLLICISLYSIAENFGWAKQAGGTRNDLGHSIAIDASGNVYTTGYFKDTVDFDPGIGTHNLISAGDKDIFIQKLDASGNFIWVKQMGGTKADAGFSIAVDYLNNVYTTGYFEGTADFDPGTATYDLTSSGGWDIFVQKLDASGKLAWARQIGGTEREEAISIAVDIWGSVFITGSFQDTVDFDPGMRNYNLSSAGMDDIFILKLNTLGNIIWARQIGGTGSDRSNSIAVDDSGNVCLTGSFESKVDFDPGPGVNYLTSAGAKDIFIQKLNIRGSLIWVKQFGGTGQDEGNSIAVDDSGYVYSTGYFSNNVDFDHGLCTSKGGDDIYVSKLNASGNTIWIRQMGGSQWDRGISIAVDDSGNVYTTGFFWGNAGFGLYGVPPYLVSLGKDDIFIHKLDAFGNFVWVRQIGGKQWDYVYSLAVDKFNNIYITGYFWGTTNFDQSTGPYNLTSIGGHDIFVVKINQCSRTNSILSRTACTSYTSPSGNYVWTTSGTYLDTITNTAGCDSVITVNLAINKITSSTINEENCSSYASPSGNHIWTASGTYIDTIPNTTGCDSVITVNLIINNSTSSTINEEACNSYTSPGGTYVWTTSGTYTDTLNNVSGCDSVITVNLTINNSVSSTINEKACSSYTSPSGNYLWTTSGIYSDTIPNTKGCDSVITVNLTINNSTSSSINEKACNNYTSPSGIYVWTASAIYMDTIPNTAGCDSVITVNLTINNSTSGTINEEVCNSYTSPGGNYVWTTSGTYTDTIINGTGCDSVIIVNLTINNSTSSTLNESACKSYTSPSGNYIWTTAGNYLDTIPNLVGCDSVITINLTFNNTTSTIYETACDTYTSPSGNHVWTNSGTYSDTITNISGCDSVISINLIINTTPVAIFDTTRGNCKNEIIFINNSFHSDSFTWDFGDGKTSNLMSPANEYLKSGVYTVILYALNSICSDSSKKIIEIFDDANMIFVPNAFSPNNDGINDKFEISWNGCYEINLLVFNRWGQKVFESKNGILEWDGTYNNKLVTQGIYRFIVFGINLKVFGTVTVLR